MKKEIILYQCTYEDRLFKKRAEALTDIKTFIFADNTFNFNGTATRHKVTRMRVESGRRGCPTYQIRIWGYNE